MASSYVSTALSGELRELAEDVETVAAAETVLKVENTGFTEGSGAVFEYPGIVSEGEE